MAWSAEKATKAFLRTLKLGNKANEPDVAEFVSALAAGSGARLMVEACADSAGGPTTLALIAAAAQTGGRVACIVPGPGELRSSLDALGPAAAAVELVVGDASRLLLQGEYRGANFVLVDGELEERDRVFRAAQAGAAEGGLVVGYNVKALRESSWPSAGGPRVDLLPIGGGLRVCRVPPVLAEGKRSQWVVRVDESTGEEHAFRITSPRKKWIKNQNK